MNINSRHVKNRESHKAENEHEEEGKFINSDITWKFVKVYKFSDMKKVEN